MKEKRGFWKINFTVWILNFALIAATVVFLIILYALSRIAVELQSSIMWRIYLIVLQISLAGFFLALIIVIYVVLHRILGPIPRMESILEKIINGEHSLRVVIREKDILQPFVDKLNKVLDLLEGKEKHF